MGCPYGAPDTLLVTRGNFVASFSNITLLTLRSRQLCELPEVLVLRAFLRTLLPIHAVLSSNRFL